MRRAGRNSARPAWRSPASTTGGLSSASRMAGRYRRGTRMAAHSPTGRHRPTTAPRHDEGPARNTPERGLTTTGSADAVVDRPVVVIVQKVLVLLRQLVEGLPDDQPHVVVLLDVLAGARLTFTAGLRLRGEGLLAALHGVVVGRLHHPDDEHGDGSCDGYGCDADDGGAALHGPPSGAYG